MGHGFIQVHHSQASLYAAIVCNMSLLMVTKITNAPNITCTLQKQVLLG